MIDLRAIAGGKYRLGLDPSAELDTSHAERAWYVRIPAKYGFVGVHGTDALLAHCWSPRVIPRLLAIEGVEAIQIGDSEINARFAPDRLDAVAVVLQARRRRRLSEEQRQRLATAGQWSRFSRRTGRVPAAP